MPSQIEVRVNTKGLDEAIRNDPQKVGRWLSAFTEDLVSRIKLSFGTSPGGRVYKRGTRTHTASAPGFPPNVDMGTLRSSIYWESTGELERTVYAGTEYAEYLEDGAEDAGIEARPFMKPAFDDAQNRIEADAAANLGLDS